VAATSSGVSSAAHRVLFAGGGTGGHLYPAIAIADALRARGATIAFAGSADRLEATIVPTAGYELHAIASRSLTRRPSLDAVRTVAANIAGTVQSAALLLRLRPNVVIATGGYVCFPAVFAARALRWLRVQRAAIALLEPNAKPGLTNRLLAPLVDEVWGAFGDADSRFAGKYVRSGVPVRASLLALPSRDGAVASFGLDPAKRTLLAMGGSQGARSINDALAAIVADGALPVGWQLLLVSGRAEYDRLRSLIPDTSATVVAYLDDPAAAYAAADLVIARAGASTLAELAAVGKPAVLIPYPFAADDHQTTNAARFAETGAAIVVSDAALPSGGMREAIETATEAARLAALQAAAARLRAGDPLATILARVEWLAARSGAASQ
jgi:UDP-N-acetylglucosamine--N-acetylmuramyl-(pentapeptide) pyrophosphoryl-undecaprenol N-acetylglucosamine transferase